jgi:hypothetical protein
MTENPYESKTIKGDDAHGMRAKGSYEVAQQPSPPPNHR